MIKRDELLKTEEYWFETLQNEIYRIVLEYMNEEDINQTQLANKLGVTRGYISQIMNGNFNYTLKKMIGLSLAVNKVPVFEFKNINEFIEEDNQKRFEMRYNPLYNCRIEQKLKSFLVISGKTENTETVKRSNQYCELKIA